MEGVLTQECVNGFNARLIERDRSKGVGKVCLL